MNEERTIGWWVLGVFAVVGVAGAWWWRQGGDAPPQPVAPVPVAAAPAAKADSDPGHPIETAPAAAAAVAEATPLPALAESDSALRAAIGGLLGEQALLEFFAMTGLASRIVATVDNLPRGKVAVNIRPVRGPGGAFVAEGAAGNLAIAAANAARYDAHVRLAEGTDMRRLAALYLRFYPLLQEAYRELGYPQGHFNDRLVAVIDHLLATPQVEAPFRLVQPKVLYEFADPALEARSAGQKLLLRMGAANAARVKARLREFRREITAAPLSQ